MKEFIVRMPDDSEEIITAVIEKFGAEIEPVNSNSAIKIDKKTKKVTKNKKGKKISPTYLFGAWKDLDIDPDKLREQAWRRNCEL